VSRWRQNAWKVFFTHFYQLYVDFIFLPFWKRANEPEKLFRLWWQDEILLAARRRSAIGASKKLLWKRSVTSKVSRHQNITVFFFSWAWTDLIQDVVKVQKNESEWTTKNWLGNKYYYIYKYHSLSKIPLQPRQASHTQAVAPFSCQQSLQTLQRSTTFVPWSVKCTPAYKIFGYSLSLPPLDRKTVQQYRIGHSYLVTSLPSQGE